MKRIDEMVQGLLLKDAFRNPIYTKDKLTLSIDNVVLDLYISLQQARDNLMAFMELLPKKYAALFFGNESN